MVNSLVGRHELGWQLVVCGCNKLVRILLSLTLTFARELPLKNERPK